MRLGDYSFARATPADLPLIGEWLRTPPVREWWIDADGNPSDPIDEHDLLEPDTAVWIISLGNRPFAYLQDYDPHAWSGHHFAHLLPRSRGLDQFIGEPGLIGQGHGSAFISAYVEGLLASGVPAVGTDPHPDNARAIRAYEKAGFSRRQEVESEWGRVLLMERHA